MRLAADRALRARADRVVPGGMYGHMDAATMPQGYPQFMVSGQGCRLRDADGNDYIDFMCGWGPIVLGRRHPAVEAAVLAQLAKGDCLNGPAPVMVDLVELLVDTIAHADWAILAKNGADATTICVTIARAATGRRKVLVAKGAYHGAAPWCTPRPAGVLAEDRAHLHQFDYNDIASVRAAAHDAGDDLAAILVCPARHDARREQEPADPAFARELRAICDRSDAVLILDDVRYGFRLDLRGSWEPLGVRPDLSAWSKAIANGYALAAVTGVDALRDATREIFTTGSFWFSAVSMAAALATITELRDTDALARVAAAGQQFREGLGGQADAHGFAVRQTGPVQMPLLTFADDDFGLASRWTAEAASRGVYLHPWHNWFLCAAHSPEDVADALERTDDAFAALRRAVGPMA